jgi:hypothetical protein
LYVEMMNRYRQTNEEKKKEANVAIELDDPGIAVYRCRARRMAMVCVWCPIRSSGRTSLDVNGCSVDTERGT